MKKSLFTLVFALVALFGFNSVYAQSPHLVTDAPSGYNEDTNCAYASIAGLGKMKGVQVQLIAKATVTYGCWNPNANAGLGGWTDKEEILDLGSDIVTYTVEKNGRVNIACLQLNIPEESNNPTIECNGRFQSLKIKDSANDLYFLINGVKIHLN